MHTLTLPELSKKPETRIPFVRDNRIKRHNLEQAILYAPCKCGSGKKTKFCCWGKK